MICDEDDWKWGADVFENVAKTYVQKGPRNARPLVRLHVQRTDIVLVERLRETFGGLGPRNGKIGYLHRWSLGGAALEEFLGGIREYVEKPESVLRIELMLKQLKAEREAREETVRLRLEAIAAAQVRLDARRKAVKEATLKKRLEDPSIPEFVKAEEMARFMQEEEKEKEQ